MNTPIPSPRPILDGIAYRCAALVAACVLASACTHAPAPRTALPWSNAKQLVVVVTPDWDTSHGVLHAYERVGDAWRQASDPRPVTVGRNGSAWGLGLHAGQPDGPVKREGDGRSPAGIFGIGAAFGYAEKNATALPYAAMQASHYCMDVSASPLYNRIVDEREVGAAAVAGSTEPMRLDLRNAGDTRYRLGFVIEHNPQARPEAGSCIFAHLWRRPDEATAGCTAMDDATMAQLLGWLRPDRHPVFVLMPQREYAALHADWNLPAVDVQP